MEVSGFSIKPIKTCVAEYRQLGEESNGLKSFKSSLVRPFGCQITAALIINHHISPAFFGVSSQGFNQTK